MLPGVVINRNCVIKKAIIDRSCVIPEGLSIGVDHKQDEANGFRISSGGVVLVTRDMIAALAKKSKQADAETNKSSSQAAIA